MTSDRTQECEWGDFRMQFYTSTQFATTSCNLLQNYIITYTRSGFRPEEVYFVTHFQ